MSDNIAHFFELGMKRSMGHLKDWRSFNGPSLELGPGNNPVDGVDATLSLPNWDAEHHAIPYPDKHFNVIHAYHFLEHIHNIEFLLNECQRVLRPGGIMNICVPWYRSQIAFQDVDHKRTFTEKTWEMLFSNRYYETRGYTWKLHCIWQMIIGVEERNMVILAQLLKMV